MVNLQDTPTAGPLTAADLAGARQHSTGTVCRLHSIYACGQCPPCNSQCQQGRACNASDDCSAPEGGIHADPVPSGSVLSMRRHYRTRATVGLALALAVAGYLAHVAWPSLG